MHDVYNVYVIRVIYDDYLIQQYNYTSVTLLNDSIWDA